MQRAGADPSVWLFLSETKFKHSDFVHQNYCDMTPESRNNGAREMAAARE
jgi:hypothetical protein